METQREFLADKLMDLGNFAAAAMIFTNLAEGQLRGVPFTLGAGLLFICYVVGYRLARKENE